MKAGTIRKIRRAENEVMLKLSLPLLTALLMLTLGAGCHHMPHQQATGCTDACYRCDTVDIASAPPAAKSGATESSKRPKPGQLPAAEQPKSVPPAEPPQEPKAKPDDGFLPPVKGPNQAAPEKPTADTLLYSSGASS